MVRVFCIISLALAAVSTVSGHVIRRRHPKAAPSGWETSILQDYNVYHERYLKWDCQNQHNTTFFDKCCHPLLKGEPMSVLEELKCKAPEDDCDDDDSSVPPPSTPTTPPQPAHAYTSPPAPPSSSSKPASDGALAKVDDTPPPSTTPTPSHTTPTSTSPPPAQTPAQKSGSSGGDEQTGGIATFYYQKGNAGACGQVHQDTDFICAMQTDWYTKENLCGKSVVITNLANGQSITVTVADECPTCRDPSSIDLSHAAFGALTNQNFGEGTTDIKWHFQ